jgi:hypothetical protein
MCGMDALFKTSAAAYTLFTVIKKLRLKRYRLGIMAPSAS